MSKFRFNFTQRCTLYTKGGFDLETDTVHKDRHDLNLETYDLSQQFQMTETDSWESWIDRIESSPLYVKDSFHDDTKTGSVGKHRWVFSDLEPDV